MNYVPKESKYSVEKIRDAAMTAGLEHAKNGIDPMAELVFKSYLPPYRSFNIETNKEDAELQRKLETTELRLPRLEASIKKVEEKLDQYANRWLLRGGSLFFLGVEYAGINELLVGQGMDNPHRTIVAIAGACIFFYLTYYASKGAKE
jgi:hypothetical protein